MRILKKLFGKENNSHQNQEGTPGIYETEDPNEFVRKEIVGGTPVYHGVVAEENRDAMIQAIWQDLVKNEQEKE